MPSSQSDWDEKYRLAAAAHPAEPASIVRELLPLCRAARHWISRAARAGTRSSWPRAVSTSQPSTGRAQDWMCWKRGAHGRDSDSPHK